MRIAFKDIIAVVLIALLAALFYLPMFEEIGRGMPCVDWAGIYPYIEFFRVSIFEYHQFPLRAPHFGGGYPLIGFPYDISLSPLSLIILAFGGVAGTKITVFLIVLCGALGVFYLTRRLLGYPLAGSLFSSLAFLFCSWGPCQYLESNYEKLYFYLLPLLLVFFLKSIERKKFIFFAALILGTILISAGSIIIPIILFLFLFACLHAIRFEQPRAARMDIRYPAAFALILLIALFISMAKVLPMRQVLSRGDIEFVHFPYENDYSRIAGTIVASERDVHPKKLYAWLVKTDSHVVGTERDDYVQMYFGYIPLILAGLSALVYWKRLWRYLVLLAFSVVLSFGPHSPIDLFGGLWRLHPYVHSIWRLDEYFTFQIFFLIAIIAGAFFRAGDGAGRRALLLVLIPVALFGLNNMFWPNRRFLKNQVQLRERSELVFQRDFFHVKIKDYVGWPEPYQVDQQHYLWSNIGLTDWLFGNLAIRTKVIPRYLVKEGDSRHLPSGLDQWERNPKYRGEVFFLKGENTAQLRYFSPNEIRVSAQLKYPDALVINQNYHKSWRADAGTVTKRNGLLAVALDRPGDYEIRLTYVPAEFYAGCAISMTALLIAGYFLLCRKARADAVR